MGVKNKKSSKPSFSRKLLWIFFILAILTLGVFIACSKTKQQQQAVQSTKPSKTHISIGPVEKTIVTGPYSDKSQYWYISKSTTYSLIWIALVCGALGIFLYAWFRAKKVGNENVLQQIGRSLIRPLIGGSLILALFLCFQTYSAKNRNTSTEIKTSIDLSPGQEQWIRENVRDSFMANPILDTAMFRSLNEALVEKKYWETKYRVDSLEHESEKGRDSAFYRKLIDQRDSCGRIIASMNRGEDSLQKVISRKQDTITHQKNEIARLESENRQKQLTIDDGPTIVDRAFQLLFSVPGLLAFLALGITLAYFWKKTDKVMRMIILAVLGGFLIFGVYYTNMFFFSRKFCIQTDISAVDTTGKTKKLKADNDSLTRLVKQKDRTIDDLKKESVKTSSVSFIDSTAIAKAKMEEWKQKNDTATQESPLLKKPLVVPKKKVKKCTPVRSRVEFNQLLERKGREP